MYSLKILRMHKIYYELNKQTIEDDREYIFVVFDDDDD